MSAVVLLQAAVDAPERFFVEIQFSNGANYDPTVVEPPRHTMPTQPRRLLTNMPGVPLQTFQVRLCSSKLAGVRMGRICVTGCGRFRAE
jgi:hypothetical protein